MMTPRAFVPALALLALASAALPAYAAQRQGTLSSHHLFSVELSSTKNQLRYEVQLQPDCEPTAEPVRAYWALLEEGLDVTRELSFRERFRHFGLTKERVLDGRYQFALNARPARTIRVHTRQEAGECVAEPWTTLTDSRIPVRLQRVWVKHEPSRWWQLSKVEFVEVRGVDEQGSEVLERLRL